MNNSSDAQAVQLMQELVAKWQKQASSSSGLGQSFYYSMIEEVKAVLAQVGARPYRFAVALQLPHRGKQYLTLPTQTGMKYGLTSDPRAALTWAAPEDAESVREELDRSYPATIEHVIA